MEDVGSPRLLAGEADDRGDRPVELRRAAARTPAPAPRHEHRAATHALDLLGVDLELLPDLGDIPLPLVDSLGTEVVAPPHRNQRVKLEVAGDLGLDPLDVAPVDGVEQPSHG